MNYSNVFYILICFLISCVVIVLAAIGCYLYDVYQARKHRKVDILPKTKIYQGSQSQGTKSPVRLTNVSKPTHPTVHFRKDKTKMVPQNPNDLVDKGRKEEILVQYAMNSDISNEYPLSLYPRFLTTVFPFRHVKKNRRGFTEEFFQNKLEQFQNEKFQVIGDASLHLKNGVRPYEPDIALVCSSSKNIRIDIEIDEPYDGFTHEPTHYVECGDEIRDDLLNSAGWIVLRFAEKQIWESPLACIGEIFTKIHGIDESFAIPNDCTPYLGMFSEIKRWTREEAIELARNFVREKYLNHSFGYVETEDYTEEDLTQTSEEEALAPKTKIKSTVLSSPSNVSIDSVVKSLNIEPQITTADHHKTSLDFNLDSSEIYFPQDNDIQFINDSHKYIYKDGKELLPVSDFISYFFKPFDPLEHAARVARRNGISEEMQLDIWRNNSEKAVSMGQFLHSQIEAYFHHYPIELSFQYEFNGLELNENKTLEISREYQYFKDFLQDSNLSPFRVEWHIFDLKHRIAGTVDLLCRKGSIYDLYDWKRSDKVNVFDDGWRNGLNGLENIPDTRYYHYCLQQNLYKYILEHNYHIKIRNMYLVVLHPYYSSYKVIDVSDMSDKVEIMLSKRSSL